MRILVIGLSNVGDGVLMSPVIERLHGAFPSSRLTLLVGERARAVFADDPRIHELLCFDDFDGWWGRCRLVARVWQSRPDVLVDLRHTLLPAVWRPWRFARYLWPVPRTMTHMRDRHLWKLERQVPSLRSPATLTLRSDQATAEPNGSALWIGPQERAAVDRVMRSWTLAADRRLVVICPGARSHIKRWDDERFARVADRLIEAQRAEVVFTGEPDESPLIHDIMKAMRHPAHNAAGRLTLRQTAALMQRARLVVTNDSASLHLAGAVAAPVVAIFGPTDSRKYGPTGPHDRVIRRALFCAPCEEALCRFHHECMRFISADEVYDAARSILSNEVRHAE